MKQKTLVQLVISHFSTATDTFLAKEIDLAIDGVEMCLNRLDNPTNLGNPSATPVDVVEDTEKLAKVSEAFIDVIITNGNFL
jgi:hypothetical protein